MAAARGPDAGTKKPHGNAVGRSAAAIHSLPRTLAFQSEVAGCSIVAAILLSYLRRLIAAGSGFRYSALTPTKGDLMSALSHRRPRPLSVAFLLALALVAIAAIAPMAVAKQSTTARSWVISR